MASRVTVRPALKLQESDRARTHYARGKRKLRERLAAAEVPT